MGVQLELIELLDTLSQPAVENVSMCFQCSVASEGLSYSGDLSRLHLPLGYSCYSALRWRLSSGCNCGGAVNAQGLLALGLVICIPYSKLKKAIKVT